MNDFPTRTISARKEDKYPMSDSEWEKEAQPPVLTLPLMCVEPAVGLSLSGLK